jgi:hypothetical protein
VQMADGQVQSLYLADMFSKFNGRGDSLGWRNLVDQTKMVPKRRESKAEGGILVELGLSKICTRNVTSHESCYTVGGRILKV